MIKTFLVSTFGGVGLWAYVIIAGLAAVASVTVTHMVDRGIYVPQIDAKQKVYDDYVLKVTQQAKAAAQKALDIGNHQAALAHQQGVEAGKAQQKEEDARHKIYVEVDHYVSDNSHCITFGLVRVLNAAAAGNHDPSSLGIAPGQSDDTCAGIAWRSFAHDITDDYASARENADQLNRLEASIIALHEKAAAEAAAHQQATP